MFALRLLKPLLRQHDTLVKLSLALEFLVQSVTLVGLESSQAEIWTVPPKSHGIALHGFEESNGGDAFLKKVFKFVSLTSKSKD